MNSEEFSYRVVFYGLLGAMFCVLYLLLKG